MAGCRFARGNFAYDKGLTTAGHRHDSFFPGFRGPTIFVGSGEAGFRVGGNIFLRPESIFLGTEY